MDNIGAEIKRKFKESGMTAVAFAERLNISRENVYSLFRRKKIDVYAETNLVRIGLRLSFKMLYRSRINRIRHSRSRPSIGTNPQHPEIKSGYTNSLLYSTSSITITEHLLKSLY